MLVSACLEVARSNGKDAQVEAVSLCSMFFVFVANLSETLNLRI
jgi:hypothetical protein